MLPYWLLFSLWLLGAVQSERQATARFGALPFVLASLLTALMIGLRFEVGGDWGAYQRMYDNMFFASLPVAAGMTDPAYAAVNWLAIQLGYGIGFVNLICAGLFMSGLARLAWRQPNPALAILVAVPYLIIVVAMGYTRQAAAIGIVCWAVADASERHLIRLVALIGLAALFHKSAVLVLPIVLVPVLRRNLIYGAFGALMFVVLFILVLRSSSDQLVTNYIQGDYDSQGAAIRVMMNVLASMVFILFYKRIKMPSFQKSFWLMCSILSVISLPALFVASASAGIDRISLYLIPLQIIAYSRMPYFLGGKDRALPSVLFFVIGYCLMVQFVWLNYANNSNYWLPYRFLI